MKIYYAVIISLSLLFFALNDFDAEAKDVLPVVQFVAQKSQQSLKPCTKRNRKNCRRGSRRSTTSSGVSPNTQHSTPGKGLGGDIDGTPQNPDDGCRRSRYYGIIVTQKVKLNHFGTSFGNVGYALNAPTKSGSLIWQMRCHGDVRAVLDGYVHMNDDEGFCTRMRMDFYTHAKTLMTTRVGKELCPPDGQHHSLHTVFSWESEKLNEVKVTHERFENNFWKPLRSEMFVLPTKQGSAKITEAGFDFGGKTFLGNGPTKAGDVTFNWSGGLVTPRVKGTLYINNAAGACARMKIEYYIFTYSSGSEWVKSKYGGKVCANDNTLHAWSVDLRPYGHSNLASIEVAIETLASDGKWSKVGSDSVMYLDKVVDVYERN